MEEINVCEKVYCKKDKEDKWRGPAKVLGKDGKTVVVKQGSDVRETNRSHLIKVGKMGDYFENEENKGESDEDKESEDKEEMVGTVERKKVNREEEETEDSEIEEEEKVDDGDTEEGEETGEEWEFKSDEEEVEDRDESEEERGVVKEKEKQLKGNIIKLQ